MVGHLVEAVRLRGAQRLIGQLQQLLRALQGFGAGAQLILGGAKRETKEKHRGVHLLDSHDYFQHNEAAVLPASFESHSPVPRPQSPEQISI